MRTYQNRRLQAVEKKINAIHNIYKLGACIQAHELPSKTTEAEMLSLVELFSKYQNGMESIGIDLSKILAEVKALVKDQSKLTLSLDRKRYECISRNILDLIKEQFSLDDLKTTRSNDDLEIPRSKASFHEKENNNGICTLVMLKDELIVTGGHDSRIKLWDLSVGDCVGELTGHEGTIWHLKSAFSGKYMLSSSEDCTIKVWRVNERKLKKTLKVHSTAVYSLEYIESKNILASGDEDGILLLWDMNEGKVQKKLEGHSRAIWSIKMLNPDNIITGGEDETIFMWELKTGTLLKVLKGHNACIYDMCVFACGKKFASCSQDGNIFFWDIEKVDLINCIEAHDKGIHSITINSEGNLLASGGHDRALRIWDLESMTLIRENTTDNSAINCTAFLTSNVLIYCDNNVKKYKFTRPSYTEQW